MELNSTVFLPLIQSVPELTEQGNVCVRIHLGVGDQIPGRRVKRLEILAPAGNEGQDPRAERPHEQRLELEGVRNASFKFTVRSGKHDILLYFLCPGEDTQHVFAEEHLVAEGAELEIYVKALGEDVEPVLVLALISEVFLNACQEGFPSPVVPNEGAFIGYDHSLLGEGMGIDIFRIEEPAARTVEVSVHGTAFPEGLLSELYSKSSLTGTLLAKNNSQLVRVKILIGQDMEQKDGEDHTQTEFLHRCHS